VSPQRTHAVASESAVARGLNLDQRGFAFVERHDIIGKAYEQERAGIANTALHAVFELISSPVSYGP